MKLFLREHLPLIIINILQMSAVLFIHWLSGYNDYPIAFYVLFISAFFLTVYLVFRYITHKDFYRRLTTSFSKLDEGNELLGNSPLPHALSQLLKKQYTLYINELHIQDKKRSDHLTFINQWVHQMKTPLSVIDLITQENEQLHSIREEADKIGKGLEMVLYAARLEAFEHDFQVEPIPLKDVVEQAIRENKRFFIKNRVYPEMDVDQVSVESDEKWLIFMMNQLITNAVKYSSGKAQKIIISGNKEEITVQDFGIGIPKSDMKRVFNPFYTGENGRLYRESTGMGLYLVKEVCMRLGHELEITSVYGEGTSVKIVFSRFNFSA